MAKAKKAKSKAAKKTASREILVVASKVKEYIKAQGLQSSSEVIPALSDKIYAMIDEAAGRTQSNNRATIRPHDL